MQAEKMTVLEIKKELRGKTDLYATVGGMPLKIVKSDFLELISHLDNDRELDVYTDDDTIWLS
jgi:hypothetical protein